LGYSVGRPRLTTARGTIFRPRSSVVPQSACWHVVVAAITAPLRVPVTASVRWQEGVDYIWVCGNALILKKSAAA
jgi:hypothetical protein